MLRHLQCSLYKYCTVMHSNGALVGVAEYQVKIVIKYHVQCDSVLCRLVYRVLSEFMVELRQQMICLYELANCIAVLDMLTAFAHVCTLNSYSQFCQCNY